MSDEANWLTRLEIEERRTINLVVRETGISEPKDDLEARYLATIDRLKRINEENFETWGKQVRPLAKEIARLKHDLCLARRSADDNGRGDDEGRR